MFIKRLFLFDLSCIKALDSESIKKLLECHFQRDLYKVPCIQYLIGPFFCGEFKAIDYAIRYKLLIN